MRRLTALNPIETNVPLLERNGWICQSSTFARALLGSEGRNRQLHRSISIKTSLLEEKQRYHRQSSRPRCLPSTS